MNITSAKYHKYAENEGDTPVNVSVTIVVDGETLSVAMDPANRHYAEILRQVAAGTLTIADAD
jgi:hypothetical protein|tara:strand:+ start:365 stop:553 length:189 start_codon:yes stop_codon:yes gene_type:complete